MTATTPAVPSGPASPADLDASTGARGARDQLTRLLILLVGAVLILAIARVITDTDELTRSGTFSAALRLAVPIGLIGLGAIYAERSGVVNIGLEGMMILGTWFGGWAGWQFGPWWGVALGILGGAIGGLVHAVATVTFGVDHIISGVAINILAGGVARYLSVITFDPTSGGGASQSPPIKGGIDEIDLPFLAGGNVFGWDTPDIFGWLERRRWFLLSDLGGLLRGITSELSWLTLIAIALVPLSYWFLWKTGTGLQLRSVGEHPAAAESLGVRVYRMKYLGVITSGAFAGLAGAFLVVEFAGIYREGQTGGRGFIGLATMIFGNWRPIGVAAGAGLFGFADALQLRNDATVHAMLLAVVLGMAVFAAISLRRGNRTQFVAAVVLGALFLVWYLASDTVPRQFVFFTPHLTTLLVLGLARRKSRMPAADGVVYRKGEAT
ncbi:MAG TPA: ABC transporter permease [Acidimicrobiales bacterium]|jgi:general nucleoside transport system permease protein|nr:ABC transporter permease [Acidimicrobiales bacterium]